MQTVDPLLTSTEQLPMPDFFLKKKTIIECQNIQPYRSRGKTPEVLPGYTIMHTIITALAWPKRSCSFASMSNLF